MKMTNLRTISCCCCSLDTSDIGVHIRSEKWIWRLPGVVCQERPPMNIFLNQCEQGFGVVRFLWELCCYLSKGLGESDPSSSSSERGSSSSSTYCSGLEEEEVTLSNVFWVSLPSTLIASILSPPTPSPVSGKLSLGPKCYSENEREIGSLSSQSRVHRHRRTELTFSMSASN